MEYTDESGEPKHKLTTKEYLGMIPDLRPICPFHDETNGYTSSGITGRGLLGKWGPNFAADPVVVMTKKLTYIDSKGKLHDGDLKQLRKIRFPADINIENYIETYSKNPIQRCVLTVLRQDTEKSDDKRMNVSIPGGMVDVHQGEKSSAAVKREFAEEVLCIMKLLKTAALIEKEKKDELEGALNFIMQNLDVKKNVIGNKITSFKVKVNDTERTVQVEEKDKDEFFELLGHVQGIFNEPTFVCNGFVEDPRNTDNAWMETCVYAFDVDKYSQKETFDAKLTEIQNKGSVGCDEGKAVWVPVDLAKQEGVLYASHSKYVKIAVEKLHPFVTFFKTKNPKEKETRTESDGVAI